MQQGGSQYGVSPEMSSYAGAGSRTHMIDQLHQQQLLQQQKPGDAAAALAEAASPISSRPPAPSNFNELVPGAGGFPDDDALAREDAERGGTSGNRWPRQETLALLKIRSEMDAAFKDATLKGPLWEDVSRKLGELGYHRNAKKCKEKFENVHKYYKRTKEGRAGRQDGKNYRFFSQLEALHSNSCANATTTAAHVTTSAVPISVGMGSNNPVVGSSSGRIQTPTAAAPAVMIASQRPDLTTTGPSAGVSVPAATAAPGISFSSNTSSSSGSEEDELEDDLNMDTRKRKRTDFGGGSSKKMMAFFERLMKEVMEKQEGMLKRFLETIEKREQDRMIREEAWRRQEMARLTREQEIMAQERAISASRDASLIAFLQKITGQTIQIVTPVTIPAVVPPPPPPPLQQQQHQPQQQHQSHQSTEIIRHQPQTSEVVLVQQEQQETAGGSFDPTSSRWPKPEVVALIKLRSGLESRYLEAGPKGPLWEKISAGMHRLGYNRSSKRCKEKWENINKYYKKVKESNKKRPEDAKTCPYFHQLDALYHNKLLRSGSTGPSNENEEQEMNLDSNTNPQGGDVLVILPPSQPQTTAEIKNNNSSSNTNGGDTEVGGSVQIQTSNGGPPPSFFEEGNVKKPEDIVKELIGSDHHHHHNHNQHNHHHHHHQQQQQPQQQAVMDDYDKLEDSDNLDNDDDDDDDEDDDEDEDDNEEDRKMAYKIEYQRPNPDPSKGQGNPTGSFLAMVQ